MNKLCRTVYVSRILLATLFLISLFLTACRNQAATPALAPDAVILAFGDSLTSGYGAAPEESYPAVLAQLTGYTVVNAGIPGEISAEGLKRLPSLLERHRPDMVILCHGANDLLRRLDSEKTMENLRQMIQAAHGARARVVLVGAPQPGLFLRTASFYPGLAAEFDIPCEEGILRDILTTPAEKSDAIHPNAAGYRRLAETLARIIGQK
ncbi:MAG: arylesterase [Syntrophotaleaceae bacterium]